MSQIAPDAPIGEVVTEIPPSARFFDELGVDYCCGGDRSLREACAEENLDSETVIRMLDARSNLKGDRVPSSTDWTSAPIGDLIDHIEQTHHAFLRRELPRLDELLAKVVSAHADKAPWLEPLQEVFSDLKPHMLRHIEKEETIVFPFIRQRLGKEIADDADPIALGPQPTKMMEMEHDDTGEALERINDLTGGYEMPEWACGATEAMLDGLDALEQDTHRHVHKENNILFPRARDRMK